MRKERSKQEWLDRLYDLRRDRRGTYERPHKPVLLLAIIDLFDRGHITGNTVHLDRELVSAFKRYFELVRQGNDRPTIENPFFFLSGDGFWELVEESKTGRALYVPGEVARAPTRKVLARATGRFADDFYEMFIRDAHARQGLRQALIARYFPAHLEALAALAGRRQDPLVKESRALYMAGRSTAFRRIVREIYDFRCAACGVRVKLNDDRCMVEAAHLIPFDVEQNDRPDNGIALCPNHHWAMDAHLIAPCPDRRTAAGVWRVGRALDARIDGQKELVTLSGRPVIEPNEVKFLPAARGLKWREERLAGGAAL